MLNRKCGSWVNRQQADEVCTVAPISGLEISQIEEGVINALELR